MATVEKLFVGLDIGSVNAKLVAMSEGEGLAGFGGLTDSNFLHKVVSHKNGILYAFRIIKVLGDPFRAAHYLLSSLTKLVPTNIELCVAATGSQSKNVAPLLDIPVINEFRALSRGAVELIPDAETILEIGGDGSRFVRIAYDPDRDEVAILDYERNGECAAGTGSFIDQQAARLKYEIEEIGPLVLLADTTANIAGRCSVFAKSDMVHAQQRGFSPAAIFKGLCEAVVRNYKGTVLKGKQIQGRVVFAGGVASNRGVVQAVKDIFELDDDRLVVPELNSYVSAIGAAMNASDEAFLRSHINRLLKKKSQRYDSEFSKKRLSLDKVEYVPLSQMASGFKDDVRIPAYLGIDVGSVSTNLVLLDQEGAVMDEIYTRTDGRPVQVVQRELLNLQRQWQNKVDVIGVGTTGSGRELIGELVGADAVHDEITAHKTGAAFVADQIKTGEVDTIFEIGGQDSKFISVQKGVVVDFAMNEACAAGTGSFLEEQAAKLGISIKEQFAEMALKSKKPVSMGERCTVFMEKDVTAYMQQGVSKEDISAGLAFAVVQNYLNRVVRGRKIGDVIFFQGGTAYNKAVAAAFSIVLNKKIIVPPHNGVIGAVGAALLAREKRREIGYSTRFRGFDLSQVQFKIKNISCKACTNQCDVQEVTVEGEKTYWGDKCSEQFRKKRQVEKKASIPNLVKSYLDLLQEHLAGPNGLGIKIGFPRFMYYFDRLPFWASYFGELGAELVISDQTNKKIVADGKEACLSEPCFPIVASHGHFLNTVNKKVDFVFIPNAINSETDDPERESWFCPWGQTLPLVLKNTFYKVDDHPLILSPTIRFRDGFRSLSKSLGSTMATLGVSQKASDSALKTAYQVQEKFKRQIQEIGRQVFEQLKEENRQAVVLVGRPYNIFDPGLNLNVPEKLREDYGINVLPMEFLPLAGINIRDIHDNMFWNYGRKILQAARFVAGEPNLHLIYFTNFKCGPDSYIKHFVGRALKSAFLVLQFDDHSNDAGIMTRCEAYLESKGLLREDSARSAAVVEETVYAS